MQVWMPRQRGWVDLYDGTHQRQLPLRPSPGDRVEQFNVQPLVDDTKEAQPWARQFALIGSLDAGLGPREMRDVHAAGKTVHQRSPVLLGGIQTGPAGENDVGLLQ